MNSILAIVIPAYKSNFFDQTLKSIANQSCKDFKLYIGDDASPDDLKSIVERYETQIKIVYHRFDKNSGQNDLVSQWERCIELAIYEEFIWLFSDDDLMPEKGVELFYKTLSQTKKFDLFRFNIRQIDSDSKFISEQTNHPQIESSDDFIFRRLKGETLSAASEYIFSRKAFKKAGGFVHFPLAWGSDDAGWYNAGKQTGIFTITGEPVLWRISGTNISSPGRNEGEKYKAILLFYKWLKIQNITTKAKELIPYSIKRQSVILGVNLKLYLNNIHEVYNLIGIGNTIILSAFMLKQNLKKNIFRTNCYNKASVK